MGWSGWENFSPGGIVEGVKRKLSRGGRMHAKPAIVDASLNVVEKSQADAFGVIGEYFHSLKEARRYVELRRLEQLGVIHSLRRQQRLVLSTVRPHSSELAAIGVYIADFIYTEDGATVVEDVKGQSRREDLYLWKKRHLEAQYGIKIREV
jgi:hypothetical protein